MKNENSLIEVCKNRRPIVLVFVSRYLPGFKSGGPVRTIANLVGHLGKEFDFRIVTSDRDVMDNAPYRGITSDSWLRVGDADVYYARRETLNLAHVRRLLTQTPHDVLYLNSFFDLKFTILPLLARYGTAAPPIVLAPRGQFSTGAIALKSWKKRPYVYLARLMGLYRNLVWQASSEEEARDVRQALGSNSLRVEVAPDLPPRRAHVASAPARERKPSEPLRVAFVSRIAPMKNLDFALKVMKKVRAPVAFRIVGPVSDERYWRRCQAIIAGLSNRVTAEVVGCVEHELVSQFIAQHDLLFLPTRGENYGHVIAESLAVGTPVLISDTTPWRNLEYAGVGWDLSLDSEAAFVAAIETAAAKGSAEYADWRKKVISYATHRLSDPAVIEANRRLFASAHTVATRPS